jgi:serine/threonine protein kinase
MVTNDLGACEWFVWDLRRSGLIDRGQLDQIVSEFLKRNPRAEAPALAEYLVNQGSLTAFQADRILNGKTQGLVLGPYVLLDGIGQGSMGQVYKALSKNDNNHYAVKVLPRRSMWNVRLARRQVRSFSTLNHQAVVPFVDVGTAGGLHYLVWPLAEGQTLENIVQHQGRLNASQTSLVGVQVAQGLSICHQNNIFHGLVKPSNIMIGSDSQARILDFGIGSLLVENEGESLVDTMSTANTLTSGLDCSSPESIMEPTNRTPAGDQYSLGCVLYYCLTGRPPFPEGSAVEKMMAHQTKEPMAIRELAPETPEGLCAVISRLMAKNPDDRFSGADELVEALEPYLGELSVNVSTSTNGSTARQQNNNSNARMAGLGRSGFHSASTATATAPPPRTQTPAYTPPSATPAPISRMGSHNGNGPAIPSRPQQPTAPQIPQRGIPSRASFTLPDDDNVPLSAAIESLPLQELPKGYSSPAALRASAGWVNDGEETQRRSNFGTIGLVSIVVLLTVMVFIGAKLLLQR